jgi:type I restriction enzyme R subunit
MMSVAMNSRDEDVFVSLANRLTRLDKELTPAEQSRYTECANGTTLRATVQRLLDAFNADAIEERSRKENNLSFADIVTENQIQETQKAMAEEAAEPFYLPTLRTFVENARKAHDQIIDTVNIDRVNVATWDAQHSENAGKVIVAFRDFINAHKDDIIALSIIYNQSWKNRLLSLEMIEELYAALQKPPHNLNYNLLWQAYETANPGKVKTKRPERMLADIVSLVRFEWGVDNDLRPFSDMVDTNFQGFVFAKNAGNIHFTAEQMNWLRMIKDFIARSLCITHEDMYLSPFNDSGGLGRFYELFGDGCEELLNEMNLALTA